MTGLILSLVCLVHCLVLPILAVLVPTWAHSWLSEEQFHLVLLIGIGPLAAGGMVLGYRRHGRTDVLFSGLTGLLSVIIGTATHDFSASVVLLVVGSILLISAHLANLRSCALCTPLSTSHGALTGSNRA